MVSFNHEPGAARWRFRSSQALSRHPFSGFSSTRHYPGSTKVPLALAEGASENATVVGDLPASLRDRRLDTTRPLLVVLGGAKALRCAVTDVFDHPIIQRLQLRKLRNVCDRLPDAMASTVAKPMRRADRLADPLVAQAELEALAWELDRGHPSAAACLREGLAET